MEHEIKNYQKRKKKWKKDTFIKLYIMAKNQKFQFVQNFFLKNDFFGLSDSQVFFFP